MCRHIAYLGPAVGLDELLLRPKHSLLEQSFAPCDMRGGGTVNADGFGVGWYPGGSGTPVRHRAAVPMWTDTSFAATASAARSGAVLAAVRSATAGMPVTETACAPFTDGRWLFSHNGKVAGWPDSLAGPAAGLDVTDLMTLEAPTDSAVLWALLRRRLDAGQPAPSAVAGVLAEVIAAAPDSRMNLLLTDGVMLVATTWTHALSVRHGARAVAVASEPFDDDPDWREVPDRRLVVADRHGVEITSLDPSGER